MPDARIDQRRSAPPHAGEEVDRLDDLGADRLDDLGADRLDDLGADLVIVEEPIHDPAGPFGGPGGRRFTPAQPARGEAVHVLGPEISNAPTQSINDTPTLKISRAPASAIGHAAASLARPAPAIGPAPAARPAPAIGHRLPISRISTLRLPPASASGRASAPPHIPSPPDGGPVRVSRFRAKHWHAESLLQLLCGTPVAAIAAIASADSSPADIKAAHDILWSIGKWDALLVGLPSGANLSRPTRAALYRIIASRALHPNSERALFNRRFRQAAVDTVIASWGPALLRAVWRQLDVLPDTDVSSHTVMATYQALTGAAREPSWEAKGPVHTVQLNRIGAEVGPHDQGSRGGGPRRNPLSHIHPVTLPCPRCDRPFSAELLHSLRAVRLPRQRQQILDGTLHSFRCPACAGQVLCEAPLLYTDFERDCYLAVEPTATTDILAAQQRHMKIYADTLQFGPPMARQRGQRLRKRLVLGYQALREKLLLWDAGLDDRLVESLKGDWLLEHRVPIDKVVLRLRTLLPGGHLLFSLSDPPPRLLGPSAPSTVAETVALVLPAPRDHVTLPAQRYQDRLADPWSIDARYPWLPDQWQVDIHAAWKRLYE